MEIPDIHPSRLLRVKAKNQLAPQTGHESGQFAGHISAYMNPIYMILFHINNFSKGK
jgi:hypothetical protein